MLQLGVNLAGFEYTDTKANKTQFRDCYGMDALGVSNAFRDIQLEVVGDAKIDNPRPNYFLMALYWFRGYGTENRVAGVFKIKTTKTFRKYAIQYAEAIHGLKSFKVGKIMNLKTKLYIVTKLLLSFCHL